MVDRAEGVGDAVLAAMADADDVDLAELGPALRAAEWTLVDPGRLGELAGVPVRSLDRPRDDVLEATEGGAARAGGLVDAEAVVELDRRPAPATSLFADRLLGSLGG